MNPLVLTHEVWREFIKTAKQLDLILKKNPAKQINSSQELGAVRLLIMKYFREFRPVIKKTNLDSRFMDGHFEVLQELASRRSPRILYHTTLKDVVKTYSELELQNEYAFGESDFKLKMTEFEKKILFTLNKIDQNIGNSYIQLMIDIEDLKKVSYKGTAHELREILREILAKLAPDNEILQTSGFKFEEGLTKPTMKQKAQFILSLRDQTKEEKNLVEQSIVPIDRAEEAVSILTRSIYTSGSESAHTNKAVRNKIIQLKMYLDAVLADILEINK
jgi:hypothetical protein